MKVTFLGTGTSQGVPIIACLCNTCQSKDPKDKRLRTSLMIETQGKAFVIDSGPDFRQQMLRENVRNLDAILFTHEHKDHIAGMDDVRAFNYINKKPIDIYAEKRVQEAIKREYSYVFAEQKYPGIPQINLYLIKNYEFEIDGVKFLPIRARHLRLPIFGFRIGDFTYFTDVNYIPQKEKEKIKGTKHLVINALRKKKHISHYNIEEALKIIDEISPEKAYLIHISHLMGLHNEIQKVLPENVMLAYDGLTLNI